MTWWLICSLVPRFDDLVVDDKVDDLVVDLLTGA
jgi:hypothetical protein